jgi:urocanate hydratase
MDLDGLIEEAKKQISLMMLDGKLDTCEMVRVAVLLAEKMTAIENLSGKEKRKFVLHALDVAVKAAVPASQYEEEVSNFVKNMLPSMLDVAFDVVTDQTSAHDPLFYIPEGIEVSESRNLADKDPVDFSKRAKESMAKHVEAMVNFQDRGAVVFDYGNSIRDEARQGGYQRAFEFPGFIPAYIRPLFCEGKGPFRWVALSGDPKDIHRTDQAVLDLFPENKHLHRWIKMASSLSGSHTPFLACSSVREYSSWVGSSFR